jgi:cytoskeletal protein CcmA (bactofilin family)
VVGIFTSQQTSTGIVNAVRQFAQAHQFSFSEFQNASCCLAVDMPATLYLPQHYAERKLNTMWKPTNQPSTPETKTPGTEKPVTPTAATSTPTGNAYVAAEPSPAAAPRNALMTTTEQATIGKSLVIKGEVTGSEALYIDGRVEGSINLPGNRVTVGRNGVVSANINAREVVVIGKVKGNMTASDRVDIRNEGSLTGDVIAARISIEDGAYFKGGIDIQKPSQKANGSAERTGKIEPTSAPVETSATAAHA